MANYKPEAVIISPHLEGSKDDFTGVVKKLREIGVRVIVLPGREEDDATRKIISSLLPFGVYDYVFDPVNADKVVFRLNNPGKLGDFTGFTEEITLDEEIVRETAVRKKESWFERIKRIFSRKPETDFLTGCRTRREMQRVLDRYLAKKRRFSFALVDFDNFKQVNDTYGHQIGDKLLTCFGQFLRENLRRQDMAFRYGGEEFALIFPDTLPEEAAKILERLNKNWASFYTSNKKDFRVTFSAGVASGSKKAVEEADRALYLAKKQGKDRIVIYSPEAKKAYNAPVLEEIKLEVNGTKGKKVKLSALLGSRQELQDTAKPEGKPTKFLMVYSSASGVGKTAVSISLASLLAEKGRVLLVDADTSGYTLTEHFAGTSPGKMAFKPVRPEGWQFDFLTSPGSPEQYTAEKVKEVVSHLQNYDYLVIDSAPGSLSLHDHIREFLEKADKVFLLCTPEAKAVGAVKRFINSEMKLIDGLKNKTKFIVNRSHPLAARTPEEVAKEAGINIDYVLPEDKFVEKMFSEAKPPEIVEAEFLLKLQNIINQEVLG
ncbi:diguanylate cyclase [Carboxydothermus ferrireducens]|uniref:diguanylate cyclase n=1 Tax=Carboxydothermus ferrireducens TaxID=54265 RepID=UPI0009FC30BF|nr:diguanylate cyclase [Carboxydothermus ferrireducens]